MSWNNVLPWWVASAEYENFIAGCGCCFSNELNAGTSKVLPNHVILISKATFKTHEPFGWNCVFQEKEKFDSLT